MNRILAKAWELWLALFFLFGLHRAFSFPYLADSLLADRQNPLVIFLNGLLSDFWLAALVTLLFLVTVLCLRPWAPEQGERRLAAAWMALLGLLTALHQPYLEFFHFQFIPFHARYFFDGEFIVASLASLVNPRALGLLAIAAGAVWALGTRPNWPVLRLRHAAPLFAAALAVATIGHAANIHYKVQLFVPTELQVHFLERLAQHMAVPRNPSPLSAAEREVLGKRLGPPPLADGDLDRWLRRPAGEGLLDPLAENLRREFAASVERGDKPLLLTVLLESSRFVDAGKGDEGAPSLTPALDELRARGLAFPVAYSTGMVTRGGQEAAWCGHLSNVATSMMRDRPEVKLDCLPRMFERRFGVASFWLHGGRGEFDSQEHFWTTQGVRYALVSKDFPADAPASGWGVSDRALFHRSLAWLEEHRGTLPGPFLNGMILTITNHTPFTLPSDSPPALAAEMERLKEPSFRTTRYTDFALGEWVEGLKAKGLWKNAVIVVVSDHGVAGEPYHGRWRREPRFTEEAMSRINLVVTGGLTERALTAAKETFVSWGPAVSQAQIAPFLADIAGAGDERFFGDHLLALEPRLPIVSDFGPRVYFPLASLVMEREQLMHEIKQPDAYAPAFYRAFLLWMNAFNVVI